MKPSDLTPYELQQMLAIRMQGNRIFPVEATWKGQRIIVACHVGKDDEEEMIGKYTRSEPVAILADPDVFLTSKDFKVVEGFPDWVPDHLPVDPPTEETLRQVVSFLVRQEMDDDIKTVLLMQALKKFVQEDGEF